MDVSGRRLARNLFPTSPVRFHTYASNDGFSSDPDTIGPMSPLSSPERPPLASVLTKYASPSSRRSPRIARRRISPTTNLNLSGDEQGTPSKFFSTTIELDLALADRIVVEESPDVSSLTPKNMKPASKESSKEELFYSPSSGINCGSFYQKPKARLSLFADFISNKSGNDGRKKRTRSISADSVIPKRSNPHKRPRISPVNKNVRHGIKKPKVKVAGSKAVKNPLDITPAKKVPLISPTDRLEVFMDEDEIDEVMAEIRVKQRKSQQAKSNTKKAVQKPQKAPILMEKVASPKSDPNKKFFKTNRTMEINRVATVTLDSNMKFQVNNGKIVLQKPEVKLVNNPLKTRKFRVEQMEFDATEQKVHKKVENILDKLGDGKENAIDARNVVLSPGLNMAAITSSTSKIFIGDGDVDVETQRPLTTSTPTGSNAGSPSANAGSSSKKLFSVFCKDKWAQNADLNSPTRRSPRGVKRQWQPISEDQYQIDAGQRRFGATQCKECGLCYQMGEPDEEIQHQQYHNNDRSLKYLAWKNERVVNSYDTGRVILIQPGDLKSWWKKAEQVLEVVDKELGCPPMEHDLENSKVYLYVHGARVIGCLACKPMALGYKILASVASDIDFCSEESYPVEAGVSRIWTAEPWRRKHVASRMLDCMRSTSVFGKVLAKHEVAFSQPTVVGKSFAMSYTESTEFMVYM